MTAAALAPEWERLDVLASCVDRFRRGQAIDATDRDRLQGLQRRVGSLRSRSPWRDLTHDCGLDPLDQDILACALAPDSEPRLGWVFDQLQPGITSSYPTPAFIRELFFLSEDEAAALRGKLERTAPLVRNGLLEAPSPGSYQPVRSTARAHHRLLGWPTAATAAPPGAVEIPARGRWADLVLPDSSIRALREYMLWITHRERVFSDWQARRVGGPIALFSGPSGTGKTFAAEALSSDLRWPLFRVDLGMLVSKYVGETEKNLNALFDAAHGRSLVLLFDEADSLFGKRGEVREARDRYANMETSHLLSRIERHDGPCILTTNLRHQLDPAFARRFQVVVEFPRPDAVSRRTLWQKHLPPRAPLAKDVDPEQLADAVVLTGGQIRNAALHAAFLAAGECMPITVKHIASAVWTELNKEGRETMRASLGILAEQLPPEVV